MDCDKGVQMRAGHRRGMGRGSGAGPGRLRTLLGASACLFVGQLEHRRGPPSATHTIPCFPFILLASQSQIQMF